MTQRETYARNSRAVATEEVGKYISLVLRLHGGNLVFEAFKCHGCMPFPLCWDICSKTITSRCPWESRFQAERPECDDFACGEDKDGTPWGDFSGCLYAENLGSWKMRTGDFVVQL